jgi:Outer membrane lipoprotein carrier protein LolA
MNPGRRAFCLAALGLGAVALSRDAEATPLDPLLTEITNARKTLRTLRGSFSQVRAMTLLATSIKSSGQLAFVAPDRLRWELGPPDDVVYWIGPEGLSYRTSSSKATVPSGGGNVVRALADLRALLTGDLGSLKERYLLSGAKNTAGEATIDGTAKDKTASVRAFSLTLDKSLVVPLKARLVEGKADTIDIAFTSAVVNQPVDPAMMKP